MYHGPLGPFTSPGSCYLTYWWIWIMALLDHCSCLFHHLLISVFLSNLPVDRRSSGSDTTWRCLILLPSPGSTNFAYIIIRSDILSMQIVNCDFVVLSCTCDIYCMTVCPGRRSSSSWGFLHLIVPLWKGFFSQYSKFSSVESRV